MNSLELTNELFWSIFTVLLKPCFCFDTHYFMLQIFFICFTLEYFKSFEVLFSNYNYCEIQFPISSAITILDWYFSLKYAHYYTLKLVHISQMISTTPKRLIKKTTNTTWSVRHQTLKKKLHISDCQSSWTPRSIQIAPWPSYVNLDWTRGHVYGGVQASCSGGPGGRHADSQVDCAVEAGGAGGARSDGVADVWWRN